MVLFFLYQEFGACVKLQLPNSVMDGFSSIRTLCLCTNAISARLEMEYINKHTSFTHGAKLTTNRNTVSIIIYLVHYIQVLWDLHVPPDTDSLMPKYFLKIIWYCYGVKLMFVKEIAQSRISTFGMFKDKTLSGGRNCLLVA